MHVMMVYMLLQVLAVNLWETRGEYPQSIPNIEGNRPKRSRFQNTAHLCLGTNTSRFSWPRRIKASKSFVAQLKVEAQNNMGSTMHRGQNGERIFNLTSFHQSKSWNKNKNEWIWMDGNGWHGTNIALRFTLCLKMAWVIVFTLNSSINHNTG